MNIVRYFWLLSARKVLQALLNIFLSEILSIKFVLLKNAQLLIDSSKMLKQQTLLKKSLSLSLMIVLQLCLSFRHNDLPWNIRQFIHNKLEKVCEIVRI